MLRNEKLKRLLSCVFTLLLLFVILMGPTTIKAQAAAVTGVAIGVIGAVAGALAAWGIGTASQGMTTSGVSDFFSSSLQSWANSVGETLETLIPVAAIGISPTGAMILNNTAVLGIRAYATWLQQQNNLQAGGQPIRVYQDVNNHYMPWTNNIEGLDAQSIINNGKRLADIFYGIANKSGVFVALYQGERNCDILFYSAQPGCLVKLAVSSGAGSIYETSGLNTEVSGGYVLKKVNFANRNSAYLPTYNSYDEALSVLSGQNIPGNLDLVPSDVIGIPTAEDIGEDSYLVDYGGTAGLTVDQAAQEILEKVVENELTSSGEIEQEQTNVTWPDITTPVAVVGLQNVFPFCIPFDIVDFLRVMNATREAPEIDWPIVIPSLNFSYTIEIDLSGFNQVASILRTMELLIFIVGLAFITRSMIIRG